MSQSPATNSRLQTAQPTQWSQPEYLEAESFVVLNSNDLYDESSLPQLFDTAPEVKDFRVPNPENDGVLELDDDGFVRTVQEKPVGPPADPNSVIIADCVIGPGSIVEDYVVGENTHVGPNTTVVGGTIDVVVENRFYDDTILGGIIDDNVQIGGVLIDGASVVNGTRVVGGVTLDDRIPTHGEVLR